MTCLSFDGLKAMGLRGTNFFRSLWVVGAALALAAVAVLVAARLHTLQVPAGPILFIKTYWGYASGPSCSSFCMQCFFLLRLLRLLPAPNSPRSWPRSSCAGSSAQPHSRAGHLALGLCRLPALSPLPQPLYSGHGARHPGNHDRHHRSRAGGPQHASRARLPDLRPHAQASAISTQP